MKSDLKKRINLIIFILVAAICLMTVATWIFVSVSYRENNINSFTENYAALTDGWVITDSSGKSAVIDGFPYFVEYGADGIYTLEKTLEKDKSITIPSPVLRFYSNYTDVSISIDGELLYGFPYEDVRYSPGTGNSWHYVRLADYDGKKAEISIRCQLGDKITYQLDAPELGSKATMLADIFKNSMFAMFIASCMAGISLILMVLYIILRKKLSLNRSAIYMALFTTVFAVYVFLESPIAKNLIGNSYLTYTLTFIQLALLPLMLVCVYKDETEEKYLPVSYALTGLCIVNFIVQFIFHFTGVSNYRVMLTFTHLVIIISILTMATVLLMTDRKKCPNVRMKLLSAFPVIIGGSIDIILLWLNKPSFNNSFWFLIGVTLFVILQFSENIYTLFRIYKLANESEYFRRMAYIDILTGLKNRNAYEEYLAEVKKSGTVIIGLGCVVIDINRLKHINDTFGHSAGDTVIKETGKIIRRYYPEDSECYRTGGDEFIIFIKDADEAGISAITAEAVEVAGKRGEELSLPIELSAGCGVFCESDTNLIGFINRVDMLMYREKKSYKCRCDKAEAPV